jgi:deazaflavin-dependent oxidoreductase (nitroreductase family)
LYDRNLGWLLGHRFLRLRHVGRRTGRVYNTLLEVIGHNPASGEFVVLTGLGASADWYRNIQVHPAVEVAVGRERFHPAFRVLSQVEAVQTLAEYERRNRWATPLVRWVLSWLLGWDYDSSSRARQRLAAQLPMIAFRPDGASGGRGDQLLSHAK